MERVKIKNFAEVVTGGTPSTKVKKYWGGTIPWLNSGELNRGIIDSSSNYITDLGLKNSSAKIMPPETVLIALTGATTGVTAMLNISASANQSVTGILPSNRHIPKYLYYYFRLIRDQIVNKSYGGAQKHISQGFVKNIEIPLPSLEAQKSVIEILDLAQDLIQKRNESIRLISNYQKSVFFRILGDPISNSKSWEVVKLGDIAKEFKYGTNNISEKDSSDGKMPILRIPNVVGEKVNYDDLKYSNIEKEEKEKIKLEKGDLLFVRTNGNPANIGRCAVFTDDLECGYASYLIRVRLVDDSPINPLLVKDIISFPSYRHLVVKRAKTTAGNYNINIEGLKSLDIYLPPKVLQDRYLEISNDVDKLKFEMQKQELEFRQLFDSLSYKLMG